jgi:hypothetical protein
LNEKDQQSPVGFSFNMSKSRFSLFHTRRKEGEKETKKETPLLILLTAQEVLLTELEEGSKARSTITNKIKRRLIYLELNLSLVEVLIAERERERELLLTSIF